MYRGKTPSQYYKHWDKKDIYEKTAKTPVMQWIYKHAELSNVQ